MTKFHQALLALAIFLLIKEHEAQAPLFLQAITSALSTIPFSGGPMTTGLVGAKLAVGSKLLYYLGFFGRRRRPKPQLSAPPAPKPSLGGSSQFPAGMTALPLPYAVSGAGGFQQFGGGFGGADEFGGLSREQLLQMMAAEGIDPVTAMQALDSAGLAGGTGMGGGGFTQGGGFGGMPQGGGFGGMPQGGGFGGMPQGGGLGQMPGGGAGPVSPGFPQGGFGNMPHDVSNVLPPSSSNDELQGGDGSENDVESFFTFLRDMDDNTCISRLICDIGADPSFLGEFSENIHGIVSSIDVQPTSGAYQYIAIMETGKREGGCAQRFPQCSDVAYEVVKNVAPSVGVPQNVNLEAINRL